MTYVVIARYRTLPDAQDTVLPLLDAMATASRAEEGCLGYRVHQGTEDPRDLALYEEYRTEADFAAHCASAHFQDLVLGKVVPLLESREVLRCAPRAEVTA
ncbi:putative quinol monooxygenase [Streptomyces catenulae]|uniref:Quinol monooxygenase n=1 Tax=Streptomyces catenulae TaxID=66875 RepID=A0ABV2Z6D9_9ACTN|nr:putative quinol monooxygenase [Streptomyces catenulae]